MPQPLSGLLVLDFASLLPGPLATLMLAEAGAEVIKVERPSGDELRIQVPNFNPSSRAFALLNRGKRSIVLDLKNADDREALKPLLQRADILVEQFRPGVMARLGLGYADAKAINPRLIYCSISGYGQGGPRAGEAGHDLNYIASSGLLALQPGPVDQPVVPPALVADIGGGSFPAVLNIMLALRQRDNTGEGCHIDIAMTDATFTFAWYALALGWGGGSFPKAGELPLAGGSPRYQLYPTNDGKLVACAALEPRFWHAFTATIGLAAQYADDARDPAAAKAAVAAIIAGQSSEEWRPIFADADCCVTIVASLEEALRDPHFLARGLFAHRIGLGAGGEMPALPVPIDPAFRAAPNEPKSAPALGDDQYLVSAPIKPPHA